MENRRGPRTLPWVERKWRILFGRSLEGLASKRGWACGAARGIIPLEAVYVYECLSGNSQVFMQTASSVHHRGAAPITLRAHSSTYPSVSCSRYFSSSFRLRRDTWKRCALAHTIDFICIHTLYVFATCFRIPSRIDVDIFSSSLIFLSFFPSGLCSSGIRIKLPLLHDRINHRWFVSLYPLRN